MYKYTLNSTWAWGNQFLWQYKEDDDENLFLSYQYALTQGINWFDTADSYGTGALSGRSEKLLGLSNNSFQNSLHSFYFQQVDLTQDISR